MLQAIILLSLTLALAVTVINYDRKHTQWYYIVDNCTIDVCRKFDNLGMAMEMYNFCIEDGHEAYLKRIKVRK